MGKTTIEWASHSLNWLTWACIKVSQECKNCYMYDMAKRYGKDPKGVPDWRASAIKDYNKLKAGDVAFVNSMSDSYIEGLPFVWIQKMHEYAVLKPEVIFLFLTKRPERLLELSDDLPFPKNLWVGTSVGVRSSMHRIETLLKVPAAGHFVSAEPLLEDISGNYFGNSITPYIPALGWIIVGAESGNNRRDYDEQWARNIRDACLEANTPFMYKQGSHRFSGKNRILDGQTWDGTPDWSQYAALPKIPDTAQTQRKLL